MSAKAATPRARSGCHSSPSPATERRTDCSTNEEEKIRICSDHQSERIQILLCGPQEEHPHRRRNHQQNVRRESTSRESEATTNENDRSDDRVERYSPSERRTSGVSPNIRAFSITNSPSAAQTAATIACRTSGLNFRIYSLILAILRFTSEAGLVERCSGTSPVAQFWEGAFFCDPAQGSPPA